MRILIPLLAASLLTGCTHIAGVATTSDGSGVWVATNSTYFNIIKNYKLHFCQKGPNGKDLACSLFLEPRYDRGFSTANAVTADAETLSGKVIGVTDGDTIKVLVEERPVKVRLAEIDTPERGQPWAKRAKQALSDKVFGQEVEVRVVNVDRYGRTVGRIWLANRDINRELVREGHAWVYRAYLDDQTLRDDEAYAQENKLGLWGLPEAERVPPWEWRRGKRNAKPKSKTHPSQTLSCGDKSKCGGFPACISKEPRVGHGSFLELRRSAGYGCCAGHCEDIAIMQAGLPSVTPRGSKTR